jgi:hypothetical protein
MIGLAANPTDLDVARELFELFKTPWEPAVPGKRYRVVLGTRECTSQLEADLFLLYASGEMDVDREARVPVASMEGPLDVTWADATLPLYAGAAGFGGDVAGGTLRTEDGRAVDYRLASGSGVIRRIGYDLLQEVRYLLHDGQPVSRAVTPTLELHIALLRHLLTESGVPFVEILPRPAGYAFACCLTHDVDFFGIRRHWFDRTLAGFALRASLGTLADLVRGRRSGVEAMRNWKAVLSLPLVFLGLLRDFWQPFESYAGIEDGRRSTFFVVPFEGRPGIAPDGTLHRGRAVKYGVSDVGEDVRHAVARGSEVAVHGIDAWRDVQAGRDEMAQVTAVTGRPSAGVRMHWLYFDETSARRLENAGFDYDSTWGYNDAVGYRSGTSQVFRLPGSATLLELPLSIMDSALFYSGQMGLSHDEALELCRGIVANARRFGGTLVVNWHGRSLAPERLWGRFYQNLLTEIERGSPVWFATAEQVVDWFRWRRSIQFTATSGSSVVRITATPRAGVPAAVVCTHRPAGDAPACVEHEPYDGGSDIMVKLDA